MFYSRASEALFLFIRLLLSGSVAFETYPSKTAAGGIIKRFTAARLIYSLAAFLCIGHRLKCAAGFMLNIAHHQIRPVHHTPVSDLDFGFRIAPRSKDNTTKVMSH